MALLSPGVQTRETSILNTLVRASTGRAATVIKAIWGPAFAISQVTDEVNLVNRFGRPNANTASSFMTANNFLQYGNDLRTVRIVDEETARNATPLFETLEYNISSGGTGYEVGETVTVLRDGSSIESNGVVTKVDADGRIEAVSVPTSAIIAEAKERGEYPALTSDWTIEVTSNIGTGASIIEIEINVDSEMYFPNEDGYLESLESTVQTGRSFLEICSDEQIPALTARYPGEYGDDIEVEIMSYETWNTTKGQDDLVIFPTGETRNTNLRGSFQYGPDKPGQFAVAVRIGGEVRESYIISTNEGDKDIYGNNIYITDFFDNNRSQFIVASASNWPEEFDGILRLKGGKSGNESLTASEWQLGWDSFADAETTYVNLLIAGSCAGESTEIASTVQKYVVGVAEERQDCVAFVSPPRALLVNKSIDDAVDDLIAWRNGEDASGQPVDDNMAISSTYAFIDGNFKYQYDKYTDLNRWVPLAGDMAGLCVYTDQQVAPWASPAGLNRGRIRNVRKFAIEPRLPHRDRMYQESINPVLTFESDGPVLWGDKMASGAPTPFDRINVRRLFNMLKKTIGTSARYKVFEINDEFTRSSFRSEVNQYLETIQTRGGVYDFRVVADDSNNTSDVIDRNEFVGSIYVKPARSINFITLNFIATSTGADFDELIGTP